MDIKSVAALFSGEISDLQKRRQPVELAPTQLILACRFRAV